VPRGTSEREGRKKVLRGLSEGYGARGYAVRGRSSGRQGDQLKEEEPTTTSAVLSAHPLDNQRPI